MSEEYGSDYISLEDEDGNEFELELLDAWETDGETYHAFIPAGSEQEAEDDADLDIIILKAINVDGEEMLSTLDSDEELEAAYQCFMSRLFDEDEYDE